MSAPPVRGRGLIEPNCVSLWGAKSPERQTMKIHQVVIVIRCERGVGEGLTSVLSAVLSYSVGHTRPESEGRKGTGPYLQTCNSCQDRQDRQVDVDCGGIFASCFEYAPVCLWNL